MQYIPLTHCLCTTVLIFFFGIIGLILNRKNILITIISLEIMLLAVNLNFIIISIYLGDMIGQIFVLFILTIAATESSIGLAILISYYKLKLSIQLEPIKL